MFLLATQPSISTVPGSFTVDTPVTPGNTAIVDVVDLTTVRSTKWIITITNNTTSEARMFEVSAIKGSTRIHSNMFGNIGDPIQIVWEVVEVGTNLELHILNNETASLTINTVRIQTLILN
jgi:hypothetical protein